MSSASNGNNSNLRPESRQRGNWTVSPKEIIFRYLKYLPWLVLSVLLFGLLAYLKIRYTVEIFRVQSSLLIKDERDQNQGLSKDERFADLVMSGNMINLSNEIEVLRSRPVLQRVGNDLNLQIQYYNKGKLRSSLVYPKSPFILDILSKGDTTQSLGFTITCIDDHRFLLNQSKTPINFGQEIDMQGKIFRIMRSTDMEIKSLASPKYDILLLSPDDVAGTLANGLKIAQSGDQTTILTLTFEGENVNLGKDILNKLMAVYDTLMIEDKNRIAGNTLRFINDRLFDLSDTLRGVEGGLKDFMINNEAFDIEGQSKTYLETIETGAKERTELEVKKSIVEYLINYISDKKHNYDLVPTILGIEEPALLQLVGEYNRLELDRDANIKTASPTAPMIRAMDSTLEKMRLNMGQALINVKEACNIATANLDQKSTQIHDRLTLLPGKSLQLLNKQRQEKILEDLYSLLLQKKLDISLSSASTISNSRVVEPAIANYAPVSPDKKKIYTLYLAIGILIPVGIIALIEILQDKVKGKTDLEKNTTAPIIGEIGHSRYAQSLVVRHNSRSIVSEQFRAVRTNLQYIIKDAAKPVILVTSTFSGEGKSFISTNIGAVMALSGKKTVILEFDIRKPKIVSGLDLKRKMGITNYIIGKASFNDLLVPVENTDNLFVIPCGPIPPNPAELLLDKKMDELMAEVIEHFEVVIMDTAPIGLVSDATSLAKYATASLYIVREGYTYRRQLEFVEETYVNKKLPNMGLILNDIKLGGGYYGGYYGRSYGYYGTYNYAANSGYFDDGQGRKKGGLVMFIKRLFS